MHSDIGGPIVTTRLRMGWRCMVQTSRGQVVEASGGNLAVVGFCGGNVDNEDQWFESAVGRRVLY